MRDIIIRFLPVVLVVHVALRRLGWVVLMAGSAAMAVILVEASTLTAAGGVAPAKTAAGRIASRSGLLLQFKFKTLVFWAPRAALVIVNLLIEHLNCFFRHLGVFVIKVTHIAGSIFQPVKRFECQSA